MPPLSATTRRPRLPTEIWILGFVSMLMDVSSEAIHALLPIFMVSTLGASTLAVGLIEGVAEATAAITKVFSGTLSDRLGKRKLLATIGYGMAAFTKPVFPLAGSLGWIVAARFVDRIGKGIRGAPRDALIADLSPSDLRGAAFGLRQSLDTIGAFLGPLLAIALMAASNDDVRLVFWVAVVPGFLSFALIAFAVHDPEPSAAEPPRAPPRWDEARRLPAAFWWITGLGAVFTLARFSEAFLVLRAHSLGLDAMWAPLIMVVMNVVYALAAYPVGVLADRVDRRVLLVVGLLLLAVADTVLAEVESGFGLWIGAGLWGLHMGFTQGVFATLVADTAPADRRGTAFGVFNLVTGVALLLASLLAGALWEAIGPQATFLAGTGFAILTLVGTLRLVPKTATRREA